MAVKTLSHEKMKEIDKFMQEVNLMKKFSHPNIVSLIGELACSLRFPHVRMYGVHASLSGVSVRK